MLRVVAFSVLTACALAQPATSTAQSADRTEPLAVSVDGHWRSVQDKARDRYRHPRESLEFWGLKPGMTILEVQPGGGWWTEILAPYARATGGKYYVTAADMKDPQLSE